MTSEQKQFLAEIEELRRKAVASVTVVSGSALSKKDKARMQKVNEDLASGRNPYYDENNESKTNRGGDAPESVKAKDRTPKVIPHPHIEHRPHRNHGKVVFSKGSNILQELGFVGLPEPAPEAPLGHTTCSFCLTVAPDEQITQGTLKPRKIIKLEGITDLATGLVHYREVIRHTVDKVYACPNCCLEIKPVLDKDGAIISQGTKFKPTEG